jgi:hypothetical protein
MFVFEYHSDNWLKSNRKDTFLNGAGRFVNYFLTLPIFAFNELIFAKCEFVKLFL